MDTFTSFCHGLPNKTWPSCPQEVAQSTETTPNKVEVINSNLPPPFVWTCQKKKKKDLHLSQQLRT